MESRNTYKPEVSKYNTQLAMRKSSAMRSASNDLSKWDNLHMDYRSKLNKRDVSQEEIKWKKEKDEYTFKPRIS